MVEWLAGNRIRGTTAERTSTTNGFNPVDAVSGGWKEVGRYVSPSGGSNTLPITISGSDQSKKYYMIIHNALFSGDSNSSFKFDGSSGNQYSIRSEFATGSQSNDSINSSIPEFSYDDSGVHTSLFAISHISNISSKEKLIISNQCTGVSTGAGSGGKPNGASQVGKWTGTGAITGITHIETKASNQYLEGSMAIVLEWDPSDTHTSNFWTQLASVNGDGTSQTLSTSTFTPKKFMMIQVFTEMGTTSHNCMVRVGTNSLSSTNSYSLRNSSNGAIPWSAHDGKTSLTDEQPSAKNHFMTLFGSNISGKEGYYICNAVSNVTTGSGTVASQVKYASKWAVEAGQANMVGIYNSNGNWGSGTTLKVWGSD